MFSSNAEKVWSFDTKSDPNSHRERLVSEVNENITHSLYHSLRTEPAETNGSTTLPTTMNEVIKMWRAIITYDSCGRK